MLVTYWWWPILDIGNRTNMLTTLFLLCLDWIPRIFWDLGNLEISFIGLDQMIELVQTFQIVPIFCEYFWIFLNKIVFELVFGASPKSTTRSWYTRSCYDKLYHSIPLCLLHLLSYMAKVGTTWEKWFYTKNWPKCDFTWVKIA